MRTSCAGRLLAAVSCGLLLALLSVSGLAQTAVESMSSRDQSALHDALDAYDQGNRQVAEPALRDLTKRYPKSYEANEALGGLYVESGDAARALPYLQRAVTLAPSQAIAHANLGAAWTKLNKSAEAVRELREAARLDPESAETESNLGHALLLTNQPAGAAEAFANASRLQPENADFAYNRALALYDGGDLKQAAAVLEGLPASAMTDQVHALAADVDERLGNYKEAVLHYQAAAQLNPSATNLYSLTLELLRHWGWTEAFKVASYGEKRYPEETRFKVAAGIALYANNQYPEAAAAFSTLLAQDPNNGGYADLLGRSCGALGAGENAGCNGLEEFAMKHPGSARIAVYAAANILHRSAAEQDTAKAEQLLRQAIVADPKLAEAYFELGVLAQQRSQWQESSAMLEKAIGLRPEYAEAHYRLSRAYAHMGKRDEAAQQIALQQQYSQQEKDHLNARMQEVVTFLLKPS